MPPSSRSTGGQRMDAAAGAAATTTTAASPAAKMTATTTTEQKAKAMASAVAAAVATGGDVQAMQSGEFLHLLHDHLARMARRTRVLTLALSPSCLALLHRRYTLLVQIHAKHAPDPAGARASTIQQQQEQHRLHQHQYHNHHQQHHRAASSSTSAAAGYSSTNNRKIAPTPSSSSSSSPAAAAAAGKRVMLWPSPSPTAAAIGSTGVPTASPAQTKRQRQKHHRRTKSQQSNSNTSSNMRNGLNSSRRHFGKLLPADRRIMSDPHTAALVAKLSVSLPQMRDILAYVSKLGHLTVEATEAEAIMRQQLTDAAAAATGGPATASQAADADGSSRSSGGSEQTAASADNNATAATVAATNASVLAGTYNLYHLCPNIASLALQQCDVRAIQGISMLRHQLVRLALRNCCLQGHTMPQGGGLKYLLELCLGDTAFPPRATVIAMRGDVPASSADTTAAVLKPEASKVLLRARVLWGQLKLLSVRGAGLTNVDESLALLPAVEVLDLSQNSIERIEHFSSCFALNYVNLSCNRISDLSQVHVSFGNLTTLNLRDNEIVHIGMLCKLYSLQKLDIAFNKIDDFSEVSKLRLLPCLTSLWIAGNPCTFIGDEQYRIQLVIIFRECIEQTPRGFVLDDIPVSVEEMKSAARALGSGSLSAAYQRFQENISLMTARPASSSARLVVSQSMEEKEDDGQLFVKMRCPSDVLDGSEPPTATHSREEPQRLSGGLPAVEAMAKTPEYQSVLPAVAVRTSPPTRYDVAAAVAVKKANQRNRKRKARKRLVDISDVVTPVKSPPAVRSISAISPPKGKNSDALVVARNLTYVGSAGVSASGSSAGAGQPVVGSASSDGRNMNQLQQQQEHPQLASAPKAILANACQRKPGDKEYRSILGSMVSSVRSSSPHGRSLTSAPFFVGTEPVHTASSGEAESLRRRASSPINEEEDAEAAKKRAALYERMGVADFQNQFRAMRREGGNNWMSRWAEHHEAHFSSKDSKAVKGTLSPSLSVDDRTNPKMATAGNLAVSQSSRKRKTKGRRHVITSSIAGAPLVHMSFPSSPSKSKGTYLTPHKTPPHAKSKADGEPVTPRRETRESRPPTSANVPIGSRGMRTPRRRRTHNRSGRSARTSKWTSGESSPNSGLFSFVKSIGDESSFPRSSPRSLTPSSKPGSPLSPLMTQAQSVLGRTSEDPISISRNMDGEFVEDLENNLLDSYECVAERVISAPKPRGSNNLGDARQDNDGRGDADRPASDGQHLRIVSVKSLELRELTFQGRPVGSTESLSLVSVSVRDVDTGEDISIATSGGPLRKNLSSLSRQGSRALVFVLTCSRPSEEQGRITYRVEDCDCANELASFLEDALVRAKKRNTTFTVHAPWNTVEARTIDETHKIAAMKAAVPSTAMVVPVHHAPEPEKVPKCLEVVETGDVTVPTKCEGEPASVSAISFPVGASNSGLVHEAKVAAPHFSKTTVSKAEHDEPCGGSDGDPAESKPGDNKVVAGRHGGVPDTSIPTTQAPLSPLRTTESNQASPSLSSVSATAKTFELPALALDMNYFEQDDEAKVVADFMRQVASGGSHRSEHYCSHVFVSMLVDKGAHTSPSSVVSAMAAGPGLRDGSAAAAGGDGDGVAAMPGVNGRGGGDSQGVTCVPVSAFSKQGGDNWHEVDVCLLLARSTLFFLHVHSRAGVHIAHLADGNGGVAEGDELIIICQHSLSSISCIVGGLFLQYLSIVWKNDDVHVILTRDQAFTMEVVNGIQLAVSKIQGGDGMPALEIANNDVRMISHIQADVFDNRPHNIRMYCLLFQVREDMTDADMAVGRGDGGVSVSDTGANLRSIIALLKPKLLPRCLIITDEFVYLCTEDFRISKGMEDVLGNLSKNELATAAAKKSSLFRWRKSRPVAKRFRMLSCERIDRLSAIRTDHTHMSGSFSFVFGKRDVFSTSVANAQEWRLVSNNVGVVRRLRKVLKTQQERSFPLVTK